MSSGMSSDPFHPIRQFKSSQLHHRHFIVYLHQHPHICNIRGKQNFNQLYILLLLFPWNLVDIYTNMVYNR
ncbi:hypothetical protein F0562_006903 [Nyssa sinensis]|uniref:Uncharacterized protein n=1 Tax=Nyssa sinensis TaxID=561372 RepID=A0A5J5ALJ3_9ASTE|nr:hypothetical protein F0562_006903 [Nyssa sinensis]